MASLVNPTQKVPLEGRIDHSPDMQNQASNTLNSPQLNAQGKPTARAITSASQAHNIAKDLRDRAKTGRVATAALIAAKYNGEPPFDPEALSRTGQAWRNNFSTNFLASIVDRVKPQMLDAINKADLLTHSALPVNYPNGTTKSRLFCEITSKVIRRWPAWRNFSSGIAQENVLYGNACPAWTDSRFEWRPKLWKFDEAFLPEGTGQHSTSVQVACFEQKMLIHDFISLIQNPEAADKAGFNVANCIIAANSVKNNTPTNSTADETALQKQDRLREGGTLADSLATKAKTVDLYHILVRDYTGGIDLWTVTQDNGLEIRSVENLHEQVEDALTLFTFQSGNEKYYGSKGLGRLLSNLHIAIERGRCLGADQMYLSGLIIFKTDKKDAISLQAKVRHPFIFVPKEMDVVQEQVVFNVQAFEMMDAKLTQLAESIAGAFIPPDLNQEGANTKIEAAQNAQREMAVKEGVLGRFFEHFADLVGAMQRKLYNHINLREGYRAWEAKQVKQGQGIKVLARRVWKLLTRAFPTRKDIEPDVPEGTMADPEAVGAVVELLESGLTVEEIAMLAQSPASVNNSTDGSQRDANTLTFIQNNRTNPQVDQEAATRMEARLVCGEDRANELVARQHDPNVEAVAVRDQVMELAHMLDGTEMPVAASDKHETHRKVLAQKLDGLMEVVKTAPTPEIVGGAELTLNHYAGHIQLDQTMPPEQKQAEMKGVQEDLVIVEQAKKALEQLAKEAAANGVQGGPNGMPVPVQGQPPTVDANGNIVGERQSINPDDADLHLRVAEHEQENRRIAIAENEQRLRAEQQQFDQAKDTVGMIQSNLGMAQEAAQDQVASHQAAEDRAIAAKAAEAKAKQPAPTPAK